MTPRDELKESKAGEVFKKQAAFLKQLAAPLEKGRADILEQLTAPLEQFRSPFPAPRTFSGSGTPPVSPLIGAPRHVPPTYSVELPATEVLHGRLTPPMQAVGPGRGASPHSSCRLRGVSPHQVSSYLQGMSAGPGTSATRRMVSPPRVAIQHFEAPMPHPGARQRSLTPNRTVPKAEIMSPRSRPRAAPQYGVASTGPRAEPLFMEAPVVSGGGSLRARVAQTSPTSASFNTTSQASVVSSAVMAEPLFASPAAPVATQSEPLFAAPSVAKQAQQGAMVPNSSTGPRVQPAGWYPQAQAETWYH